MAINQKEAHKVLNDFASELADLIIEHLVGQVTPSQINEYYGWGNNCQIAEMLIAEEEVLKELGL